MGDTASKLVNHATDIQTTVQSVTEAAQNNAALKKVLPIPPGYERRPGWGLVKIQPRLPATPALTFPHFMQPPPVRSHSPALVAAAAAAPSGRIAPIAASTDATFTDKLQSSLSDTTVLASSAAGGASGLLLGGENKIVAGLIGFSTPILFHALLAK